MMIVIVMAKALALKTRHIRFHKMERRLLKEINAGISAALCVNSKQKREHPERTPSYKFD
jgi:hypothetical protein